MVDFLIWPNEQKSIKTVIVSVVILLLVSLVLCDIDTSDVEF